MRGSTEIYGAITVVTESHQVTDALRAHVASVIGAWASTDAIPVRRMLHFHSLTETATRIVELPGTFPAMPRTSILNESAP
jgi:hypothetical protein